MSKEFGIGKIMRLPSRNLSLILTVGTSVLHPSRFSQILGQILLIHGSFPTAFFGPALKIALLGTENGPRDIPQKVAKNEEKKRGKLSPKEGKRAEPKTEPKYRG